nr:putative reverse transcriptase domain-containing protein [Tanacetum cinerariifolium]
MTSGLDLPKQILGAQTEAKKPENLKKEDVGVMTIGLDLPKQILKAQTEARKPENIRNEDVGGVGYLAMVICGLVIRFGKWGKLNPRHVRPFKVLKKVGSIAYKIELPQELSRVHSIFHVSNLKKYYYNDPLVVPLEGLQVDDKLHFGEEPIEVMDREVKQLR